jgi:hypothetical protein
MEEHRGAWRRRDQLSKLTGFGGELLVDKVYRFEEMEGAFADILRRLGLPAAAELERRNVSPRARTAITIRTRSAHSWKGYGAGIWSGTDIRSKPERAGGLPFRRRTLRSANAETL